MPRRITPLLVVWMLVLGVACGGIPIGPGPAASSSPPDETAAGAASGTAVGPGSATPTAATPRASEAPRSLRAGLAVVAVGKITYARGEGGSRTISDGSELVRATHALAKQLYAVPRLRPHTDEATVATLAGGELDPNGPPSLAEIGELRSGLNGDLGATTRALLESLARRIDVEGIVVVTYSVERGALARLFHVDSALGGGLATRLDGAMFSATERPAAAPGEPSAFVWDAASMASLLGPAQPAGAGVGAGDSHEPLGPRRKETAAPPHPKAAKAKPDDKKKSKTIFESPWFWVAAGSVAAIGVTALVVSQTVDTKTGTIHVQGKVLP